MVCFNSFSSKLVAHLLVASVRRLLYIVLKQHCCRLNVCAFFRFHFSTISVFANINLSKQTFSFLFNHIQSLPCHLTLGKSLIAGCWAWILICASLSYFFILLSRRAEKDQKNKVIKCLTNLL